MPGDDARPVTDPTGRYKGTNYDPDYARKKYGAGGKKRDKGYTGGPRQGGYEPYVPGGYQDDRRYSYGNGNSYSYGYRDNGGPAPRSPLPFGQNEGQFEYRGDWAMTTPQAAAQSPHWTTVINRAPEAAAGAPAPRANASITPSSAAVSNTLQLPDTASSPTTEISSLEKLKLFKGQVEASRRTRAESSSGANAALVAESFLQSVAGWSDPSASSASPALPDEASTQEKTAPVDGSEDGEIPDSHGESRAQQLKEKLRLKLEERRNAGSQGNGTPVRAPSESPASQSVHRAQPDAPTNGPSPQSLRPEQTPQSSGWARALEERLSVRPEDPRQADSANGRYAEAARQRHDERNAAAAVRSRARSLSPVQNRNYQRNRSPSPPRDHYLWSKRSPEPPAREWIERRQMGDRYEGVFERAPVPPPAPPPASAPPPPQEAERIVYNAPVAQVTAPPAAAVLTPTTAWVVRTLQLLKEQILELEKLIDPAVLAMVSGGATYPPQPAPPSVAPPPPPASHAPRTGPPSEYAFSDEGYKGQGQYNKPGYNPQKSYQDGGSGRGGPSNRGRGPWRAMERGLSQDGNRAYHPYERRGSSSRDWQ